MTEQLIIDLGTEPDDGNGDTLYEAFTKVNINFSYLFDTQVRNIIQLRPSQQTINEGTTEFGLQVLFPNNDTADVFYDTSLFWLNPVTGTTQYGAFKFEKNNSLTGIFTNSINTYNNQNLNLLSKGTGVVTVAGTNNYEQQVFHYNFGTIDADLLLSPKDPDALINAQSMIDFVSAYATNYKEKIVALDNSSTQVIAETAQVRVIVDNQTVAVFTETETQLGRVLITDQIVTPTNQDLVLNPGLNLSISSKRITNLGNPVDPQDAVNLRTITDSALGLIINLDLTDAQDGSLLIYNSTTKQFEASNLLNKQEIDAGIYN